MKDRVVSVDFTKGTLVALMVVYHSLNYFMDDLLATRYLRFVSGSFVFMAGYLTSAVYLGRYGADVRRLSSRLVVRGLKIFLVFALLNVLIHVAVGRNYTGVAFGLPVLADNALQILLAGDKAFASFEILLPIAYLLMAGPLLLQVLLRWPGIFRAMTVGLILFNWFYGPGLYNLKYLTIGILGVLLGRASLTLVDSLRTHSRLVTSMMLLYQVCLLVDYPVYPLYCFGVVACVAFLAMLATCVPCERPLLRSMVTLGRYSLLGYMVQIAVLQVLRRSDILNRTGSAPLRLTLAILITLALTALGVELMDLVRRKWSVADRAYRAVFA